MKKTGKKIPKEKITLSCAIICICGTWEPFLPLSMLAQRRDLLLRLAGQQTLDFILKCLTCSPGCVTAIVPGKLIAQSTNNPDFTQRLCFMFLVIWNNPRSERSRRGAWVEGPEELPLQRQAEDGVRTGRRDGIRARGHFHDFYILCATEQTEWITVNSVNLCGESTVLFPLCPSTLLMSRIKSWFVLMGYFEKIPTDFPRSPGAARDCQRAQHRTSSAASTVSKPRKGCTQCGQGRPWGYFWGGESAVEARM